LLREVLAARMEEERMCCVVCQEAAAAHLWRWYNGLGERLGGGNGKASAQVLRRSGVR
jgi:hypothetical protein